MSSGKNILFTTYSTAFLHSGGGEGELVQIAELLESIGYLCDIYGVDSRPIEFYDYVMHFSVEISGEAIFYEILTNNKKVILWPNMWLLKIPSEDEINRINRILKKTYRIIFRSQSELDNFSCVFEVDITKCRIVKICLLDKFTEEINPRIAQTICNFKNYVLCIGRIEPVKNQLRLIKAVNFNNYDAIFIGGIGDRDYYEQCKSEARNNVQFLPYIQPGSVLLKSIISNSRLVAELSFDPPGRSSIEAAYIGRPLILSDDKWVQEYFINTVYTADPFDELSIIKNLKKAFLNIKEINKEAKRRIIKENIGHYNIIKFADCLFGC